MLVLALDTSSTLASVALARVAGDPWSAEVLAASSAVLASAAGEGIVALIDQVLRAGASTLASIELLAVGVGPGSFTGTRVAVATAKGLAIGSGIPLRGVTAFEALAVDAGARPGERVLVAIDARKSEVYAAAVAIGLDDVVTIGDGRHLAPAALADAFAIEDLAQVAGDGVPLVEALRGRRAQRIGSHAPRAAAIAALAGARQTRAKIDDVDLLEPLYVRPPDITMPTRQPGMPGRRT